MRGSGAGIAGCYGNPLVSGRRTAGRTAVSRLLLCLGMMFAVACSSDSESSREESRAGEQGEGQLARDSRAEGQEAELDPTIPFLQTPLMSDEAFEIFRLIDERKLNAAEARIRQREVMLAEEPMFMVLQRWAALRQYDWTMTSTWETKLQEYDELTLLEAAKKSLSAAVELDPSVAPFAADVLVETASESLAAAAKENRSLLQFGELTILSAPERVANARVAGLPRVTDQIAGPFLLFSVKEPQAALNDLYGGDLQELGSMQAFQLQMQFNALQLQPNVEHFGPRTGPWYEMLWKARELDPDVHRRWAEPLDEVALQFRELGLYYSALVSNVQSELLRGTEWEGAVQASWATIQAHLTEPRRADDPLAQEQRDLLALVAFVAAMEGTRDSYLELYKEDRGGVRSFVQHLADRVPRPYLMTALRFEGLNPALLRLDLPRRAPASVAAPAPSPTSTTAEMQESREAASGTEAPSGAGVQEPQTITRVRRPESKQPDSGQPESKQPEPKQPESKEGCQGSAVLCARIQAAESMAQNQPCEAVRILEPHLAQRDRKVVGMHTLAREACRGGTR